jgi:hypothetical protein
MSLAGHEALRRSRATPDVFATQRGGALSRLCLGVNDFDKPGSLLLGFPGPQEKAFNDFFADKRETIINLPMSRVWLSSWRDEVGSRLKASPFGVET